MNPKLFELATGIIGASYVAQVDFIHPTQLRSLGCSEESRQRPGRYHLGVPPSA